MRVRVSKPKMQAGGQKRPLGNGKYFPLYHPSQEFITPPLETNNTLGAVPRDQANLEAEGGESALIQNNGGLPAHYKISGPRHAEGGTPLQLPKDSFIYSDTRAMNLKGPLLKFFGKGDTNKSYTPADLAKQYDLNKWRRMLQDPDSDPIQVHTAELMMKNYEKKLGALALLQEGKKGFPDGIPVAAMPFLASMGASPKSVLPDDPTQQGTDQQEPSQDQQQPMAQYGLSISPRSTTDTYIQPRVPGYHVEPFIKNGIVNNSLLGTMDLGRHPVTDQYGRYIPGMPPYNYNLPLGTSTREGNTGADAERASVINRFFPSQRDRQLYDQHGGQYYIGGNYDEGGTFMGYGYQSEVHPMKSTNPWQNGPMGTNYQMGGPQQDPSQDEQMQQLLQGVSQALQQGTNPKEVLQQLVQMGLPQDQAVQLIQQVMQQQPQQASEFAYGGGLPIAQEGMSWVSASGKPVDPSEFKDKSVGLLDKAGSWGDLSKWNIKTKSDFPYLSVSNEDDAKQYLYNVLTNPDRDINDPMLKPEYGAKKAFSEFGTPSELVQHPFDYGMNLLDITGKSPGYLMTGQWKGLGDLHASNDPSVSKFSRVAGNVLGDPTSYITPKGAAPVGKMLVEHPQLLAGMLKDDYQSIKEILPYLPDFLAQQWRNTKGYGKQVVDWVTNELRDAPWAAGLNQVVVPGVRIAKGLHDSETANALKDPDSAEEQLKMAKQKIAQYQAQQAKVNPPSSTSVVPLSIPDSSQIVPENKPFDMDSLRKAAGLPPRKQRGGELLKAKQGITLADGKYTYEDESGKTFPVDKSFADDWAKSHPLAKAPASGKAAPGKDYDPFKETWIKGIQDKGYTIDPSAWATETGYPSTVPSTQAKSKSGTYGMKDWWEIPDLRKSFENRHQWFLKDFKEKYGHDFDPTILDDQGHSADTLKFQQAHNAYMDQLGLPRYFDNTKGHGEDQMFGEVTAVAPDPTKITKGSPTAQTKPGDIQANKIAPYNTASPNAPWWRQDVNIAAGDVLDWAGMYRQKPWAPKLTPVLPDATFVDPTRELASNAEQMAIGTQGADAFSGPQAFNSRFSQIQGEGAKNAANILGRYNNENIQIVNQNSRERAGILNQTNQHNAAITGQLWNEQEQVNAGWAKDKQIQRDTMINHYNNAITNRAKAQAENSMFPYYQVDPSSGGFVTMNYQDPIHSNYSPNSGSDFNSWKEKTGLKGEDKELYPFYQKEQEMQDVQSRRLSDYERRYRLNYPGQTHDFDVHQYGGFIPDMYPY